MLKTSSLNDEDDSNDTSSSSFNKCFISNCGIDHSILTSPIINNMLNLEESYTISHNYFNTNFNSNSSRIDASMRSTLTTWMLEVCEEEQCTNEVFSLAVNIFDRFMCALNKCGTQNVEKYHLQLFGITCLFIAGKLKANSVSPLNSLKLVDYTAHSVTLSELLEWESIVLDRLKWDIAAICPNDYLEFFLHVFAPKEANDQIKKHAYAFTALCATDFALGAFQPASMIASACFLTAINSVCSSDASKRICASMAQLIRADVDCLWTVREQVEDLFKRTQHQSTSSNNCSSDFETQQQHLQDFEFIHEDDLFQFDAEDNLDEHSTYDELIKGFETESSSSNDAKHFNNNKEQLKFFGGFNVTSDSLFDCINDLNLNDYEDYVSVKKTTKSTTIGKKAKKSESNRSSVSSDSSGISSGAASSACSSQNTHNYLSYLNRSNCFQLTPPLANLLPMPTFDTVDIDDTVTKKKTVSNNACENRCRSSRRKQKLVLF